MPPRPARRTLRRPAAALLLSAAAFACLAPAAAAGKLECDRSKKYRLNERHGPWVVMCATFHPGLNPDAPGLTAEQAADELVYELREKGIPAEAWVMDSEEQTLETTGRDGAAQTRVLTTLQGGVAVMAGNFPSADDPRAVRALAAVKKMQPACLTPDPKQSRGWTGMTATGGKFRLTPGRSAGPLARAILTPNPLMSDADRRNLSRRRDPLLVRLNGGQEYTLGKCPGKYSLVVAQFRGKTLTQVAGTKSEDLGRRVELSDSLDDAAKKAWELCQILRNRENAEAYVWHTRTRSVVTVGGFDGPNDPAAARLARRYGATAPAAAVAGQASGPQARTITVPKDVADFRDAKRYWLLEPRPYLMEVPAL